MVASSRVAALHRINMFDPESPIHSVDWSAGIRDQLADGTISSITESNVSFHTELTLEELGLPQEKMEFMSMVDDEGKVLSAYSRMLRIDRKTNVNLEFQKLDELSKANLSEAIADSLSEYTHIWKIIEARNPYFIAGYVENRVRYIVYGVKSGWRKKAA
jgi:hypothetical protein